MDYNLLQEHTVNIYQLRCRDCVIRHVNARSLLKPQRFDLFAKLYYIKNVTKHKEDALRVYREHIKAFNPDGHEPGRQDKNEIQDFVSAFDFLIEHFKDNDFDDEISVIPVDRNGVILDGAHRVAVLAYYDKTVTIAQYQDIVAKCNFDYKYFQDRGLAWAICDIIAYEMTKWCDNLFVACLWPRIGNEKIKLDAIEQISSNHRVVYTKKLSVNLTSLSRFVHTVYQSQSWTDNDFAVQDKAIRIYGNDNQVIWFAFFENVDPLEKMIAEKERWRAKYGYAKDSLHVTDSNAETLQIANLVLTKEGLSDWLEVSNVNKFCQITEEKWYYFKKVTWMNLKSKVWQLLHFSKCYG